jgi:hypothetical protein
MSATIEALLEGPAKKDRSFQLLLHTLEMCVLLVAKYFHAFSVRFYGAHYGRNLMMNLFVSASGSYRNMWDRDLRM